MEGVHGPGVHVLYFPGLLGLNADYLFHHQFHLSAHSCHNLSLNHKVYKITFPPRVPDIKFPFNFIS